MEIPRALPSLLMRVPANRLEVLVKFPYTDRMKNKIEEINNSPTWKVCKTFNSALLEDEKEGERLNEILCTDFDEAECLVDLLNGKEREVARLRELLNRAIEAIPDSLMDEDGGLYENTEHTKLKAAIEAL